jgi:hypothetical protein
MSRQDAVVEGSIHCTCIDDWLIGNTGYLGEPNCCRPRGLSKAQGLEVPRLSMANLARGAR